MTNFPDLSVSKVESLVPELVDFALSWASEPLGTIAGLSDGLSGETLQVEALSQRARNVVVRQGLTTLGRLSYHSCSSLGGLPHAGEKTVREIVNAYLAQTLLATVSHVSRGETPVTVDSANEVESSGPSIKDLDESDRPSIDRADSRERANSDLGNVIGVLAEWAIEEGTATTIGELWTVADRVDALPPNLSDAWSSLNQLPLREFVNPVETTEVLAQFFSELHQGLGDRNWVTLKFRLEGGMTLADTGAKFGISRQRVHQLETKNWAEIGKLLERDEFRLLRWRTATFRRQVGAAAPTDSAETSRALSTLVRGCALENQDLLRGMLLKLAGDYEEDDGWLRRPGNGTFSNKELLAVMDEDGLIPAGAVDLHLSSVGIVPAFRSDWLAAARFRDFGHVVAPWTGSIVDKCVVILAVRGEPADVDTLLREAGEERSSQATRNVFAEDERIVRVSRLRWGLKRWGLPEFNGIVDEIAQRIRSAGGALSLEELIGDASRLDVKPTSIRVYSGAPMFVVAGGQVRLRREDEPFVVPGSLAECPGVFRSAPDRISMLVPVDGDVRRGSGRALRDVIARDLGVTPGHDRVFRSRDGEEVRVTWPVTSLAPALGSIRLLARKSGAVDGDRVRLDFDLARDAVAVMRLPADPGPVAPEEQVCNITGLSTPRDLVAAVAESISVPSDKVIATLRQRGDEAIAELLGEVAKRQNTQA